MSGLVAADWLQFVGGAVGALGGAAAAYFAIRWERSHQEKESVETLRSLIQILRNEAVDLEQFSVTRPAEAVRAVHRAFCAVRDTSKGLRTLNASLATIAVRMEHTTVWPEIERLRQSQGIAAQDAVARSGEILELCDDLDSYLQNPAS